MSTVHCNNIMFAVLCKTKGKSWARDMSRLSRLVPKKSPAHI